MSDLYEVYNLPAPRQRTFFSSSDSLTRARFPNFLLDDDPASSCRHFVNGLLRWQFSTTIGAQFIFLCAWQAVTLALLTAVICIKIYHRKFWVVRLARTKKGRMIAYNTTSSFVVLMPLSATVAIPMCVLHLRAYYWHVSERFPSQFMLVVGPFLFPIAGIVITFAGLTFALSGKGDLGPIPPPPRRMWFTALLDHPRLWNIFCIFVPTVPLVPVLVTSGISAVYGDKTWDRLAAWDKAYADAPMLSREMLLDAIEIWDAAMDTLWYACVALVVLACEAALILLLERSIGRVVMNHVATIFRGQRKKEQTEAISGAYPMAARPGQNASGTSANAVERANSLSKSSEPLGNLPTAKSEKLQMMPAPCPHTAKIDRARKMITIHLFLHSMVIVVGCIALGSLAVCAAALLYGAIENARFDRVEPILVLISSWLYTSFGFLLTVSTIRKDYDLSSLVAKLNLLSNDRAHSGNLSIPTAVVPNIRFDCTVDLEFDRTVDLDQGQDVESALIPMSDTTSASSRQSPIPDLHEEHRYVPLARPWVPAISSAYAFERPTKR